MEKSSLSINELLNKNKKNSKTGIKAKNNKKPKNNKVHIPRKIKSWIKRIGKRLKIKRLKKSKEKMEKIKIKINNNLLDQTKLLKIH